MEQSKVLTAKEPRISLIKADLWEIVRSFSWRKYTNEEVRILVEMLCDLQKHADFDTGVKELLMDDETKEIIENRKNSKQFYHPAEMKEE